MSLSLKMGRRVLFFLALCFVNIQITAQIQVWVTTGNRSELLDRWDDWHFDNEATHDLKIYVNENHLYQEMEGFGASLTDASAWLLANVLSDSQRDTVMRSLFSREEGIGVSFLRQPIGASDFSLFHYSYNDLPPGQTDVNMEHFSIEHDREYIIPLLQWAKSLNPSLKILGTPWSPPGWMKTSGNMVGGSLLPQFYQAHANYLTAFVGAYKAEGLPISYITVQNEPGIIPEDYPGMRMTAAEQTIIVRDFLGPTLRNAHPETGILAWDHNWEMADYPIEVMQDPKAREYVAGSAFHCYEGLPEEQAITFKAYPEKPIFFTECSSGDWANNFADNLVWDTSYLEIRAVRNWARSLTKWNLVLDENFGPHTGGCPNCEGMVTVEQATGNYTFNHDYYALGHLSQFVVGGAHRIASTHLPERNLESVAFKNPNGSKVLLVLNSNRRSQSFDVFFGNQSFDFTLRGRSVVTFIWQGAQVADKAPATPVNLKVERTIRGHNFLEWDFEPDAKAYKVYRATRPGGEAQLAAEVTVPFYVDDQLRKGTRFFYRVEAVNTKGNSALSVEVRTEDNIRRN